MAVPSQETAAVGQFIAASLWNDDVRDAVDFLLSPPRCRLWSTAAVSATTSTYTAMTWNSEDYDTDGMHSTSSNTSRITIVTPGLYQLSGVLGWAGNATGRRWQQWYLNGVSLGVDYSTIFYAGGSSAIEMPAATTCVELIAGDYVELFGWQDSGVNLNMNPTTSYSYAEARWVAA
jgi:hypothetical protein